jgi:hypothetical protein
MLLPIKLNPRLMKEDAVLEARQYHLYQSIIRCYIYLVTCTRPNLIYPISYLSQFLAAPSKSHLMAAKHLLWYIKGTKDLKLFIPPSDVLEITLKKYFDSEYGNYLDIRQSISGNHFWLNNSIKC